MSYRSLSPASAARREELTCKICSRTFNRHEHLQRHTRTHTKDKPYICSCGRSFSRKDLLTRHERLSHGLDGRQGAVRENVSPRRRQPTGITDVSLTLYHQRNQGDFMPRSISNEFPESSMFPQMDASPLDDIPDRFIYPSANNLPATFDDPISEFTRFLTHGDGNHDPEEMLVDPSLAMHEPTMPDNGLLQNSTPDSIDISSRVPDDPSGDDDFHELKPLSCPWLLTNNQYLQISSSISPFQEVIPNQFRMPSKMALARYLLGYVEGFSDHHPFIHVPTLNLTSFVDTPELILALLAIGAQYRYESRTARSLYRASRSIVLERLRKVEGLADTASVHLYQGNLHPAPAHGEHHLDQTQALLLLAIYCFWHSSSDMLQEWYQYLSLIAASLRRLGLSEGKHNDKISWAQWIKQETKRRTQFFGWYLLNFQAIIYDNPPLLLTRELNLQLPSSCQEWVARTETEWERTRSHTLSRVMLKEAHAVHLAESSDISANVESSPMGNYILIHAVIQRIYMMHQVSLDPQIQRLSARDVQGLETALNRWRHTWCHSPESKLDLHDPYGSLSFSATALLGVAHVRLHYNLGQWRDLQSGDPATVAATLHEAPLPQRGSHLVHALLHSVHALNIPVQVGISYLSRCKSFGWSVDHAVCDLECAIFLSKWLQMVAQSHVEQPLSALETRLIRWIIRVVREALVSQDETISLSYDIDGYRPETMRRTATFLSFAVVKVWAQMFKVCNSPWPMVLLIGKSLDRYASLMEGPLSVDVESSELGSNP
ncbi:C2H2-type zinc finger protein [Aspergillus vadensis CBS 113365]|uniref:C2H2-type domain-containing protein n=1 Tax=Aspergillus vadensis (strain CBS 113365 / IMI 142717 / IBT 24658) TaxID=1448311 RepID=A0A319ATW3_ASPVC|nr:hypothetical protein BO88DRAFT_408943 [Aspergillus vadensis CBS 113365]PYH63766.1 hypothetical protein BO88DRAFT_408943 [Aspergillus vadensis CBS 113365]